MSDLMFNQLASDLRDFAEGKVKPPMPSAAHMSLRDYMAGQVISDLVMDYGFEPEALDLMAFRAYMIADAMMRERSK